MPLLSALIIVLLMCSCQSVEKNKLQLKEFAHDVLDEEIDDLDELTKG